MTGYIEREAFLDAIERGKKHQQDADDIAEMLQNFPAADVRSVVRGKWIDDKGNPVPWDELDKTCPRGSAYCSICGEWLTASDEYPAIGNFCPNCGADMREKS